MNTPRDTSILAQLGEATELECKPAHNGLPEDLWRTYSALANTYGGVILLGAQRLPNGRLQATGLPEPEWLRTALWDGLHNRAQISHNLLAESDVSTLPLEGKSVLRIRVPRASRQQRPVHVGSNPFGGTYLRRPGGDTPADDETVRRLLAEQVESARDDRVLKGFDFSDLDMDTVAAYRNRFAAVKPGHAWTDLPLEAFLERIGAFGKNREEGYSGLRLAGLLMFGRGEVIRDALPHYMLDYQERPAARTERRWVDRLVPDGSWSGNVYDFFRKVYQKLGADLKVPFQLQGGQRVDDTPVHEALREALANALIHADFSGRASVLVVKRPDMFGFRNPGRMRIAPALAIQGGNSDCRNRRLQTMFQLVGYGDHAGSGLLRIHQNWAAQQWRTPQLYEQIEPEQTLLELRMHSLMPAAAVDALTQQLGPRFTDQPEAARLALVLAQQEGQFSLEQLRQLSPTTAADAPALLAHLVHTGLLEAHGPASARHYSLATLAPQTGAPGQNPAAQPLPALFSLAEAPLKTPEQPAKPPEKTPKAPEQTAITPDPGRKTPEIAAPTLKSPEPQPKPAAPPSRPSCPVPAAPSAAPIDPPPPQEERILHLDWDSLPASLQAELRRLGEPVSRRGKVSAPLLRDTILALCQGRYLGLRVLAQALDRDSDDLRKRALMPMLQEGSLQPAFSAANSPKQAYTSASSST